MKTGSSRTGGQPVSFWVLTLAGVVMVIGAVVMLVMGSGGDSPGGASASRMPVDSQPLTQPIVEELLRSLPAERRAALVDDRELFDRVVLGEAARRAVLAAAYSGSFADDPKVQALMRQGAERVLVDLYLNDEVRRALPSGFPSDEDIQAFYDAEAGRYGAAPRLEVWQIFLPLPPGGDEAQADALRAEATALAERIRTGQMSFAEAAARFSGHAASRVQGGYVGQVVPDRMLPGLRTALAALEEGVVSTPVESREGLHILKRGALIPGHRFSLDAVRDQVRRDALAARVAREREKALEAVRTRLGGTVDGKLLNDWHSSLVRGERIKKE